MKNILMTCTLIVLAGAFAFAQSPSIGGYNVYYGSLHNHCNHSDGTGTADQAYNYARNTANLDFFSLADHAEQVDATEWATTKSVADLYNQDGVFTAFWGFEWSHSTLGHVAVINTTDYCASSQSATNTFPELLTWLSTRDCIAFFNHPGRQDGTGAEFGHFTDPPSNKFVGMELWNKNDLFDDYYYTDGYYPNDGNLSWFDEALARGWKIGAGGAEDNHSGTWGTATNNRMAILANNLTRNDLYTAMQQRRFFTTTDKNIALSFKVDGNEMGSTIMGGYYNVVILASDGDNEIFTRVDLLKNGQVIHTWTPNTSNVNITQAISALDGEYFYIRVKQTDGNEAISSPVHISGNIGTPPTCQITAPANNTQYPAPQQITIAASASDADGSISQVEFFVDGVSIGVDATAPYTLNWTIPFDNTQYVITAAATDNLMLTVTSSPVSIVVGNPPLMTTSIISTGLDDVEEDMNGGMYTNSTDIELVYDGSTRGNQVVGLRFLNLNIPQGSVIANAWLQFTNDEAKTGACNLVIQGEATDHSQPFSTVNYNVSSRSVTATTIAWVPPAWSVVGQAGSGERTPDLSALLQEIVNRPGFTASSAVTFIIRGTGTRTAEAYEGSASQAPKLVVYYNQPNNPPSVAITQPVNGSSYDQGTQLTITANATDADGSITKVDFYIDGVLAGTDLSFPYNFNWSIGLGAFELTAIATDNLGAFTVSAPVTVTGNQVSTEIVLTYDDFESGWGNWTSGGIDALLATSSVYAHQGVKSANIQDNSGTASSFYHTNGINITTYSQLKIEFWFYAAGMENKEDFWLQYYNGSTWTTLKTWKQKTNFLNGVFYYVSHTISSQQYNFPANMKLRFMCDASDDTDDIYIDEIKVTGITGGSSNMKTAGSQGTGDAIHEMEALSMLVHPNPSASGVLHVRLLGFTGVSVIDLMDLKGQLIQTLRIEEGQEAILSTSNLTGGIYLVRARNDKEQLLQKVLVH